jgi:putative transposase
VKAYPAEHRIATMCRVLGVSASGYYAWQHRAPSTRAQRDAALTMKIHTIHLESRGTYGAPRVHAELTAQGITLGRKRVARLMRRAQLRGVSRRKWVTTTTRNPDAEPAPDLVQRQFTAPGRDQLWVADITYVPTGAGFLYLAVVLDAWSRRVIGWAMETHLRTELVLAALDMALHQRRPSTVIHHSDHGCQYTSIAFGQRCDEAGVRPSMGSVGDAYDNALCESFFATLECELLDRTRFATSGEARAALFDFIEGWYNPRRRHSALGYESPIRYERLHTPPNPMRLTPTGSATAVLPLQGPLDEGGAISLSPQTGLSTPSTGRGRP